MSIRTVIIVVTTSSKIEKNTDPSFNFNYYIVMITMIMVIIFC